MKVAVQEYHAGKAWLCICVGVEPPFSKSWIRHCDTIKQSERLQNKRKIYHSLHH